MDDKRQRELLKLKGELEEVSRKIERQRGVLETLQKELKVKHGFGDLEQAKDALSSRKKKLMDKQRKLEEMVDDFEKRYSGFL